MKIQFHIHHDSLNCPLIVSGKSKLIHALAQLTNFNGPLTISARSLVTAKISVQVVYLICNNILAGKPTIFQYMGDSYLINDHDEFITMLYGVNTERLYVDGEVVKTSATTYQTVFRRTA
ncbi:hypothetical protein AAS21_gp196 [Pantoea phage vB_PagS_AAS21]|uniref:Uncharacterized protein n=1 Tax=Pantoea phage vB_PagS_AAS21 TaxID=2575261 RepID=A0A4Y5P1T4_9CAUD|nr:hypothetical protein AAS21_gp196 [Pantoea phage vB_PagS_AAS21]